MEKEIKYKIKIYGSKKKTYNHVILCGVRIKLGCVSSSVTCIHGTVTKYSSKCIRQNIAILKATEIVKCPVL